MDWTQRRLRIGCLGFAVLIAWAAPVAGEFLPVDDFNDANDRNDAGGYSFVLTDGQAGSAIAIEYVSDPAVRYGPAGYSLKLTFEINTYNGWCAWAADLNGLNAAPFDALRFRLHGSHSRAESFTVLLRDRKGNRISIRTSDHLSADGNGWRDLDLPLDRGQEFDWSDLDTLMLILDRENLFPGVPGALLIDDIRFEKIAREVAPARAPEPSPPAPAPPPAATPTPKPPAPILAGPAPSLKTPAQTTHLLSPREGRERTEVRGVDSDTQGLPPSPQPSPARGGRGGTPPVDTKPAPILTKPKAGGAIPPLIVARPAPPETKPAPILTKPAARGAIPPLILTKPAPVLTKQPAPTPADKGYLTYDAMENPKDWATESDQGASLQLKPVPGVKGQALSLTYSFGKGGWVQMSKPSKADLSRMEALRLRVRVVKGTVNLEIKLTDEDFSNFGKKYEALKPENEWATIDIPIEQFTYWWGGDSKLDMKTIRGVYIAVSKVSGNAGEILVDDIEYKSRAPTAAEVPGGLVLIDSFERSVPENAYSVLRGDNSVLNLESVRDAHDGNYSMRFDYTLETTRSIPTHVGASSAFATTLDWRGVDRFNLWVRGDGSSNHLRINLVDRDEEVWSAVHRHVLKSSQWQLVSIPIADFNIPGDAPARNKRFDVDEINKIEIQIVGDRTDKTTGTVWVDEMYVTGKNLDPNKVGPAELRKGLVVPLPALAAAFNFGIVNFAEFSDVPEEGQKVNHYGKILMDAQFSKFSTRLEIASDFQDYGASAYFDTKGTLSLENPRTVLVNSQINVSQIHPNLRLLTLGYLWIDFGRWTFTPQFGSKGLKAEGSIGDAGYEAFVIKKRYESYAAGSRVTLTLGPWLLQSIFVYDNDVAQQTGATLVGGQLVSSSSKLVTRPISKDFVGTLEVTRKLSKDRITLSALLGRNLNTQFGTKTGTFSPTVVSLYDSPRNKSGNLGIFEARLNDYPWKKLSSQVQYRWIGTHFKPNFREAGLSFDDAWADQQGYNLRFLQSIWKMNFAGEYDRIDRLSATHYNRRRSRLTCGYYGIRNVDIAVSGEQFAEVYKFSSDRTAFSTDKNEKKFSAEAYVGLRVSDKLRTWAKAIEERITHPGNNNAKYKTDIFQTRFEYFVSNNSRIFAEYKFTQFGNPAWEPIGSPFDDNFTKLSVELNF